MNRKTLTQCAMMTAFLFLASGAAAEEEAHAHKQLWDISQPPTLTASGQGEVFAPPDRATVRLGAEVQAEEAAAAQATVNTTIQKALEAIQKAGIPKQAIQTLGLHLTPVYAPNKPGRETEPPKVVAYRASNTIQVHVDDLSLVGKVVDAGIESGANRLQGISFELKNDLPFRTRALKLAVAEARAKAQAMAEALDVTLVKVREINEGGVSILPHRERMAAGRVMTAAAPTPVEPGEVRVQASVTLSYEIVTGGIARKPETPR